ncbi:hypothetical protein I79_020324 [Cricetulus griseus]|uniref:Uncharacterized protein n=1 Tax=Cricetulus griseus TaxID=10029 RepID=G3I9R9_CRIGR|nr:hypothetical protein I79_020324 [Cricetulus griseus]
MSKMMQPKDQMSDLQVKENLRASGAIQDFWQGSVGRIKVGEPLSPMFPGVREQSRSNPSKHYHSQSSSLYLPVLRLQACSTTLSYAVPTLVFLSKGLSQEPFSYPPWVR